MIAWTIPATLTVTGATSATSTSSSSSSESNSTSYTFSTQSTATAGLSFSSNSGSTHSANSYSESRSAEYGTGGTTTFLSSSSSYSSFSDSTVVYRDLRGTETGGSSSASASLSTSGSSSSSTALPSYSVQTSTTKTFIEYIVNSFASSIDEEDVAYGYYTTSKSDTDAVVEFIETELPATVWYEAGENKTITRDSTTLLSSTTRAGAAATVVQAFTNFVPYDDGYHQTPEVLYFISDPQTSWNGYLPATSAAQSGTRFTIWPSYSTVLVVPVNGATTTTQSTANAALTFSTTWKASTTALETKTRVTYSVIPNSTSTFADIKTTTTGSTASGTVFSANTISFGRVDLFPVNTTSSVTTLAVVSYSTIPTTIARRYGSLTFESQAPSTVSSNRIITTSTAATNQTSASATNYAAATTYEAAKKTTASGSGISISGVQTVYGPAQISTTSPSALSRSIFATTGAIAGGSTGLWFTANSALSSPYISTVRHGSGRLGITLFPTTNSEITISGNSITWLQTYEEASNNTTRSIVASVAGNSYTFLDTTTAGAPLHHGGGSVGQGCTVVDVAGLGAYKDRIGGGTTSFSGAATVLTEGQSQPIKSWFPVTAISPLSLREARHGITFSTHRNSNALPPA